MPVVRSGWVMLLIVLIGMPGYAAERLVPYDDFNATSINPDRWLGGQSSSTFPHWGTEAIRQIQDHHLRLMYRSYGATAAASGTIRSEWTLMFRNSAAITAMQAAVTVTDAVATGCPGSGEHQTSP